MTTTVEEYLETQAPADAMAWWHGLTDEDRVDIFMETAPIDRHIDAWERER